MFEKQNQESIEKEEIRVTNRENIKTELLSASEEEVYTSIVFSQINY